MKSPSLKRSVARTFVVWIALFQLVVFCLSAWWVAWPLLRAASNDFAALIVLSAQTWVELPPERRDALQTALSTEHGLDLVTATAPLPDQTSYLPFIHLLQKRLTELSGQPAQVVWDESGQRYLASLRLGGTQLRFAFARQRIGTNPPLAILAILCASLSLALLVAHLVSRRLSRPLVQLERAVQAVGRGETPALPVETGVRELNGLSREFNGMARQLRGQAHTRTTLLAGVSHDLRSPIARLRMALELARDQPAPLLFDNMERYLEQMDELIGDFIDYGRGSSQRAPQPLDLASWLAQLANEHQAVITACDDLTLATDPAALERVLVNLLENARRYAPASPPHIECKALRHQVQIDILDRGPGIPPELIERVFDPFYRIDPARQTPGSGLGLAVVREICRAHSWRIELSNRPGGGLLAHLILPLGTKQEGAVSFSPTGCMP
jgi:two-component system, OmpR family, osmolarity sensor histidine kinase EnvZ